MSVNAAYASNTRNGTNTTTLESTKDVPQVLLEARSHSRPVLVVLRMVLETRRTKAMFCS